MTEPPITEYQEQLLLVQWLDLTGLKYSSIPNSTYTKSIQQKLKNKRSGLRPGLPDLVIAIPGTGVVWIELKRTKMGRVSAVQQEWIDTLNACPGNAAYVCYGFEAARKVIESYLPAHASIGIF